MRLLVFDELAGVGKVEHERAAQEIVVKVAHLATRELDSFLQHDLAPRLKKPFPIIGMSPQKSREVIVGHVSKLRESHRTRRVGRQVLCQERLLVHSRTTMLYLKYLLVTLYNFRSHGITSQSYKKLGFASYDEIKRVNTVSSNQNRLLRQ